MTDEFAVRYRVQVSRKEKGEEIRMIVYSSNRTKVAYQGSRFTIGVLARGRE